MIVYKTFSFIQILFSIILKVTYIWLAAIALYHYHENPFVTSGIAVVCILFFLLTGQDNIIVSSEFVEYNSTSILKLFRKRKMFKLTEIKSIKAEGSFSTGDELYSPTISKDKSLNKIEIKLKNGSIVNIQTSIYIDKLKRVELEINNLLRK